MALACNRACLETAIHEARATKAALTRSRTAVRKALAGYYKADARLARSLRRVQGVPHPKPITLKRFGASESDELVRLARELSDLRAFVPRKMPAKRRRRAA